MAGRFARIGQKSLFQGVLETPINISDHFHFLLNLYENHGDFVRWPKGENYFFLLSHPRQFRHVLQEKNRLYVRSKPHALLKPLLGHSIVTSDGKIWGKHRKIIQPFFHPEDFGRFIPIVLDEINGLLSNWQSYDEKNQSFEITQEMGKLILNLGLKTFFPPESKNEVEVLKSFLTQKPDSDDFIERKLELINPVLLKIIEEHQQRNRRGKDFLSFLLETDQKWILSSDAIREEMLGILITGTETLAQTLGWTFYLLTQNPWALKKIKEEAQKGSQSNFSYARRVISESLRLYPYIYQLSRTSIQDDEMDGHKIPKGSSISLFVYGVHRHKDYWRVPEQFDPERFHPQSVNSFPKEAYIPFGMGPHLCLGKQVALLILPLVVAEVCKKFHISLDPKVPVEMKGNLALGTQNGIHVNLRSLSSKVI